MRVSSVLVTALCAGAVVVAAAPPEPINHEVNARIRQEARDRSQIMSTLHMLTDVYGPRLTGSPNHKAAAEWTIARMKEWGFSNGHLEPWDFGHPGWLNERMTAHITSPVKDALVGEVLAWTNGTNGPVKAAAVQIEPPDRPTPAELTAYLDSVKSTVAGKIVLVGKAVVVPVTINKTSLRRDYDELRAAYDPVNPRAPQFGGPGGPGGPPAPDPSKLTPRQMNEQIDAFLVANGAKIRINDAGRDHGQIRAFNNATFDGAKATPTLILRNEDYGRISRLLADKRDVQLDIDIANTWYPEGKTSYNAVAEIPGTDLKNEVIMLGGHLDSWHAATGATDNAIGVAVMMEAARILKALDLKPRRTIRVALWGGEEQGLLGSKAYVEQHFGTFENQKPEYATFGGYFNVDSGTGRIRGASVFGPADTAQVLRDVFAPFEDLGIIGATVTKSRRTGGTDSTSFNAAGLPGIGLAQDPIEYGTYTWHTNLDTYERIIEDDVKKTAAIVASAVYHLATREKMLSRFPKDQMPGPGSAPTPGGTPAPTTTPAPTARP